MCLISAGYQWIYCYTCFHQVAHTLQMLIVFRGTFAHVDLYCSPETLSSRLPFSQAIPTAMMAHSVAKRIESIQHNIRTINILSTLSWHFGFHLNANLLIVIPTTFADCRWYYANCRNNLPLHSSVAHQPADANCVSKFRSNQSIRLLLKLKSVARCIVTITIKVHDVN